MNCYYSLQDAMYLHQTGVMKDVVMMIGEMIVDHPVVMMVAGGAEMKGEADDRCGYKDRDEDGRHRDDRRDASPRRNKQEREVDEEGFEIDINYLCSL